MDGKPTFSSGLIFYLPLRLTTYPFDYEPRFPSPLKWGIDESDKCYIIYKRRNMKMIINVITLKRPLLVLIFMLLGCVAIHATDDLITQQITIKLDEAGTLPDKIGDTKKYLITNLKIIGEINGTDLRLIRDMTGRDYRGKSTSGKLATLDLSEVKIVSGGDYYYIYEST